MKGKKKNILNLLFLAAVFGLTIYGVFKGEDLHAVLHALTKVKLWYLLFGMIFVIFFIWGESIIIHYMLGTLSIRTRKRTCFLYSCVGFFFSCITPSASGGQPAQIYYMKKNEIPISVSTLVLMVVTITYKSILVFTGLFLVIFQRGFVNRYLTGILPVFYLGVALNVFCCAIMLVLVFHPVLAKNIMQACLKLLVRMHILKDKPERAERLTNSMEQYTATAAYFKKNKKVIVNVTLITFVQRFALFFVTYLVYRAFGLSGTSIYDVMMLQAAISIAVDMLPLPGGMGISEKLFLMIFPAVFGTALLLPGMILSRGLAYYSQLLFSAAMTVVAHFVIGKPKPERVLFEQQSKGKSI
ncbi:lysylphosphatidylglycerol synthase transmembrane domain-containing protein [Diplocloster modestus]|uniref:Phosphatidylglycerol lysyltransferase n=1 Tax=Diplocloster modestus TaxID=2850322 RepID=A0ABS6KBT8_9FIRM|nr:flippase-like domain-containing protein [Diplocloster modestus]